MRGIGEDNTFQGVARARQLLCPGGATVGGGKDDAVARVAVVTHRPDVEGVGAGDVLEEVACADALLRPGGAAV